MPMTMLGLVADAVIRLALHECGNTPCGIREGVKAGTANRPFRCSTCPLDAVDRVADEMEKENPDAA
jgi:hypothetical protein